MRSISGGYLRKMHAFLDEDAKACYEWVSDLNESGISLNSLLGHKIQLRYRGDIQCIYCARPTKKSFSGGYCYPCARKLARCDLCVLRPSSCHYHLGTCREPEWGLANCMRKHIVYLAETSGLKVGLTRAEQIPTRWLDQGAMQALAIVSTQTRYQAGLVESLLASETDDITKWRIMLTRETASIDLPEAKLSLFKSLGDKLHALIGSFADESALLDTDNTQAIHYPVLHYPQKPTAINLDKEPEISGCLEGIKGQYLLIDGRVLNIRKFSGYGVDLLGD